jgi:HAD superfamily hydrolase (TIGR01549 family)
MEKQRFIFDLDGTLIDADFSLEKEYFKKCLSEEDAKIFLPNTSKLLGKYEDIYPHYDVSLLSEFLTLESGVSITPEIIRGWRELISNYPANVVEGVEEVLEYLKRKDKSLVVLTNWFSDDQKKRLETGGLTKYFDYVYGGDNSYLKPNKSSYIEACGIYPMEECVIIGDSLERDVLGAMNIGLDSIYYNPKGNNSFNKNKVKSIGSMNKIKEMF